MFYKHYPFIVLGFTSVLVTKTVSTATYIHDLQEKNVVVGQNVTFNFTTVNNTGISSLNFGIYSGGEVSKVYKTRSSTRAPKDGNDLPSNLVPRLSFVGNLTRGEAWYKIVNARKNDSGTYGVKIVPVGAQLYSRAKVNFEVLDDTGPTKFSTTAQPNRQTTSTGTYVHDLQEKNVVVGGSVTFNFTTVNNMGIHSLNFGIYSHGEVRTVYKTRSLTRPPVDGNDLPTDLKTRLRFVGNLTAGKAWYKIANVRKSDSGTYGVKILLADGTDVYSRAKVTLNVVDGGPTCSSVPLEGGLAAIFCFSLVVILLQM